MSDSPKIQYAKSFSVYVCQHGHLYIQLLNGRDQIFAVAPMNRTIAFKAIDAIMDGFSNPRPCSEVH